VTGAVGVRALEVHDEKVVGIKRVGLISTIIPGLRVAEITLITHAQAAVPIHACLHVVHPSLPLGSTDIAKIRLMAESSAVCSVTGRGRAVVGVVRVELSTTPVSTHSNPLDVALGPVVTEGSNVGMPRLNDPSLSAVPFEMLVEPIQIHMGIPLLTETIGRIGVLG
jgi:hypothetical protein